MLIILTVFEFLYIIVGFGGFAIILNNRLLDISFVLLWLFSIIFSGVILWVFQIILTIYILKYNRKNMSTTQEKNRDSLKMIMFTGIIGLWLWLPTKKEIDQNWNF